MAVEESEEQEILWLTQASSVSDFALLNEISSSADVSTFVASCTMDNFPWPKRRYLLKLEESPGARDRSGADNQTRLQMETGLFSDLAFCPRMAKLLAQFEDTVGHFLMPHSGSSGQIHVFCYVWQHHPSVRCILPQLPSPLPCCLALKWTTDIMEGISALSTKGVVHIRLKREYVGVDRQHRLVICPAAVQEHLALQYSRSFNGFDVSDTEGTADRSSRIQVNRTVARFCSELIWARSSIGREDTNMTDSTTGDENVESLCSLPRDYPPGFSEIFKSLMSPTSQKGVTLDEALIKLRTVEETLERNGGAATLCGSDVRHLTVLLTTATRNQFGAFRRRERQLVQQRDAAIKSLEDETSKQEALVEEIELLAKEKHAMAREQEGMTRKLKKLKHRRNVYAKKYRLAAAGKPDQVDGSSPEERSWRHSRNLERCEALLERHDIALQELHRLADEQCVDSSGVDSEGSDDVNFGSVLNSQKDSTEGESPEAESGVFHALKAYQSFMKRGERLLSPAKERRQDADGESSGTDKTETTSCDTLLSRQKPATNATVGQAAIISLGVHSGWWKKDVLGQTAVTAHELDSRKLLELSAELTSASCAIQQLEIGWTDLEEDGCVYLAEALKKNTTVENISLHHCDINAEGAAVLAAALDYCPSVNVLRLNWNNVGSLGVTHFVPILKRNNQVASLELCWNNIDAQGADSLAAALTGNCSLTSLDLSNNYIGPQGACRLAEGLTQNSSLTKLGLKGNGIGGEGARAIARAIRRKTNLQHLNLSYNGFGDGTASVLASVLLEDRSGLTELDLSGNDIETPGARQLALGLKANKTLTHLNLAENSIDDAGGIEFAGLLRGGCYLSSLVISGNQLSHGVAGLLQDVEWQGRVIVSLCEQPMENWDDEWTV